MIEKHLDHLEVRLKEFYAGSDRKQDPLFYTDLNGSKSELSSDTFVKMIKIRMTMLEIGSDSATKHSLSRAVRKTRVMDQYRNGASLTHPVASWS